MPKLFLAVGVTSGAQAGRPGVPGGLHQTGGVDPFRTFRHAQRFQIFGVHIQQAAVSGRSLNFHIRGKQARKNIPYVINQLDAQFRGLAINARQPLLEAGKGRFQIARRGLAFPQPCLKTTREFLVLFPCKGFTGLGVHVPPPLTWCRPKLETSGKPSPGGRHEEVTVFRAPNHRDSQVG